VLNQQEQETLNRINIVHPQLYQELQTLFQKISKSENESTQALLGRVTTQPASGGLMPVFIFVSIVITVIMLQYLILLKSKSKRL
jgi:hypothetical protein